MAKNNMLDDKDSIGTQDNSANQYIDSLFPELVGGQQEQVPAPIQSQQDQSQEDSYIDTLFPELKGSEPTPIAPPESITGKLTRGAARTTARVAETVLGLPGDIVDFFGNLMGSGLEKATGVKFPSLEDVKKLSKEKGFGDKPRGLLGYLPETAPTSQKIRETLGGVVPEGYLEPKTETETLVDNFVSDAASLLVPIGGKIPFKKSLAVSGLGNLAGWLSKKIGASEGEQTGVKLGTMIVASMGNPFSLKKYAKELYPNQATRFMREANEASKILNWIRKWTVRIGEKVGMQIGKMKIELNPITATVLGAIMGKGKMAAVGAGLLYGAGYTERLARMLSRDPQLRKFYAKTFAAASAKNSAAFIKNVKKLNDRVEKSQKIFME